MPTPTYSIRLPEEVQTGLRNLAKSFGAPNERRFVRSVLETVISHDRESVQWLQGLLRANVGEQLAFVTPAVPSALAVRGSVRRKRGKGGRKRGRRT